MMVSRSTTLASSRRFAVLLTAGSASAVAANRIQVAGTATITDFGSEPCAAEGSPLVFRCAINGVTFAYAGDLTGTSVENFTEVVTCRAGTLRGHCSSETFGDLHAHAVVASGTGDLAGVKGTIDYVNDTYEGTLR